MARLASLMLFLGISPFLVSCSEDTQVQVISKTNTSLVANLFLAPDNFTANETYSALGKPVVEPNMIICDQAYGSQLRVDPCNKAFKKIPEGDQFDTYVTKLPSGASRKLKVPIYYDDLDEGEERDPKCTITIDLAGRSLKNNYVSVRRSTLQDLVRQVNNTCVALAFGTAGFATYHLERTINGMAKYKAQPAGYDAPVFLTAQISKKGSRKRPGNTDPRIGQRIMEVVKDKIKNVHDSFSKDKLRVLYNDLVETRTKMVIGGEQSWWDNRHVTTTIPQNVQVQCRADAGKPFPRDCEDASFFFIGEKSIVAPFEKGQAIEKKAGNCIVRVMAREEHKCTLDVIRATIDILLNTCIDGPEAPGTGGLATAGPVSLLPTSTRRTTATTATTSPTLVPHPWNLPPTYLITMRKSRWDEAPCVPYLDPETGADTGFCLVSDESTDGLALNSSLTASADASLVSSLAVESASPSIDIVAVASGVSIRPHPPIETSNIITSRDEEDQEAPKLRWAD